MTWRQAVEMVGVECMRDAKGNLVGAYCAICPHCGHLAMLTDRWYDDVEMAKLMCAVAMVQHYRGTHSMRFDDGSAFGAN